MNSYVSALTAQDQVTNGLQHAMLPGLASLGSPTSTFHGYRRLPNTEDVSLDQWLVPFEVAGYRAHQCTWPDCLAERFTRKHKARNHIKTHLGITKVFECITWYVGEPAVTPRGSDKTFACQGNAKTTRIHKSRHIRATPGELPCICSSAQLKDPLKPQVVCAKGLS